MGSYCHVKLLLRSARHKEKEKRKRKRISMSEDFPRILKILIPTSSRLPGSPLFFDDMAVILSRGLALDAATQ